MIFAIRQVRVHPGDVRWLPSAAAVRPAGRLACQRIPQLRQVTGDDRMRSGGQVPGTGDEAGPVQGSLLPDHKIWELSADLPQRR